MKGFIVDIFKNKNVRFGGYAALIIVAVLAGIVVVNLIVQQTNAQFDMTSSRLFSLSEQTQQVLDDLEDDVTIYGLYRAGEEAANVVEVLKKYERASKRLKLEYIDPELNPAFGKKYDPDGVGIDEGSLIIERGDEYKVINRFDIWDVSYNQSGQARVMGFKVEQQLTNAILFVTSGITNKIYELTGHGEYNLEAFGLKEAIERENYAFGTLNLITSTSVPEDASVLSIISPKFDLSAPERDKLIEYLEGGGRAMILLDFTTEPLPNFAEVLNTFGIFIEPGIVMEGNLNYLYQANPYALAPELMEHEINEPLAEKNLRVLMPQTLAISETEIKKRNIVIEPLLKTSAKSFIRRDLTNSSVAQIEGDDDGPVAVAVAINRQKTEMSEPEGYRIIVSGNGQFVGVPNKGNLDFLLNSLAWTNYRKDTISVRSKSLFKFPLEVSGTMMLVYSGIFIVLIPLIILVSGLVVWLRRRHL